jgi:hypothetical protein
VADRGDAGRWPVTATYDEVLISLGMSPSTRRYNDEAQCGTYSGYNSHLYFGEDPCEPCREANRQYKRKRYAAPKDPATLPPIEHGTPKGARQHWYRGESPCDRCRVAYYAWQNPRARAYYSARKAKVRGGGC